jgi:hypothetical protein
MLQIVIKPQCRHATQQSAKSAIYLRTTPSPERGGSRNPARQFEQGFLIFGKIVKSAENRASSQWIRGKFEVQNPTKTMD